MVEKVIPIRIDEGKGLTPPIGAELVTPHGHTKDTRGRTLRDLRISVTDRCNFRCTYCMPKEVFDQNYPYLAHKELLSFEEITRLTSIFATLGVEKIRLTGGEPLLRKNLEVLIEMLAKIQTTEGKPLDLTLTTNGSILRKKATALKAAGLQRLTVSLDGLDDAIFKKMNDVDFPVADVLDGIAAAQEAGFQNIKVNMVVKKGTNDHEIVAMAKHFKGSGVILRFIEFMDVGSSNGWNMEQVLPSKEVIARIHEAFPLEPVEANYTGEVAQRWRYVDGSGEIGVISSVTQTFCHECSRARISTDGQMYLCLFANEGFDFKTLLRSSKSDLEIANAVMNTWSTRNDHYSEIRGSHTANLLSGNRKVEMSYIGG
ncbi:MULTISPECIES: GTP 3',8-cyclase MoaA [unclassified Polynucleobacter]|uniref:GTP 3',8-cyclase MoaA n=1 Tax=unclassified Polynucleobacter TaxID=2640945 RepID=UPI001BFE01F7|nr:MULTISPECIES: GTP 3',8-cyclase MoaA [unclassified Polynucleobacter]MBU3549652.1 GTP 3',8-cyclase MoaA [Polynucleobacter sp. P1-05-14]MBU3638618.1 GTP 3',8-cyclase MoaA [Polynucleobacter sp. AP-RePozz3-80-G7]MEA9601287.1 GTP 3',8-cyclase MoaA [Polynucleobacter sp. MG-28-Ekke-A2]QWD82007.1 GTP 3',8-cyclase MoaA [Polynucleobacter sp. MWH-S4W17]